MARCTLLPVALFWLTACHGDTLSGTEIHQLLDGARVRGHHDVDRYDFERLYTAETFTQTGGRPGTARWRVKGDQICVSWTDRRKEELCRYIVTDHRGAYWKELRTTKRKKNGDSKTITKTVLTYTSIEDATTGADRRDFHPFWWVYLYELIALAGVSWVGKGMASNIYWGLPTDPTSRISLARRQKPMHLAGFTFDWNAIKHDPDQLVVLLDAAMTERDEVVFSWAVEALAENGCSAYTYAQVVTRLRNPVERADLLAFCLNDLDANGILAAAPGDDELLAELGRDCVALAKSCSTSNEMRFTRYKAAGETFLGDLRGRLPAGDTVYDAQQGKEVQQGRHALLGLVGAAYEELLYLKYVAPVRKGRGGNASADGG